MITVLWVLTMFIAILAESTAAVNAQAQLTPNRFDLDLGKYLRRQLAMLMGWKLGDGAVEQEARDLHLCGSSDIIMNRHRGALGGGGGMWWAWWEVDVGCRRRESGGCGVRCGSFDIILDNSYVVLSSMQPRTRLDRDMITCCMPYMPIGC